MTMEYSRKIEIMSEGFPGAAFVLNQLSDCPEWLDYLWEFGPYGEEIWLLYRDWCGEDTMIFCQVLAQMMKHRQPEVWKKIEAEHAHKEIERFAQEWEKYDVG